MDGFEASAAGYSRLQMREILKLNDRLELLDTTINKLICVIDRCANDYPQQIKKPDAVISSTPYNFELVHRTLFRDSMEYSKSLEFDMFTHVVLPRGEKLMIPRFIVDEMKRRDLA